MTCVCGHPRLNHQHYRRGTDCGICGHRTCPRYRTTRPWWQIWRTR